MVCLRFLRAGASQDSASTSRSPTRVVQRSESFHVIRIFSRTLGTLKVRQMASRLRQASIRRFHRERNLCRVEMMEECPRRNGFRLRRRLGQTRVALGEDEGGFLQKASPAAMI